MAFLLWLVLGALAVRLATYVYWCARTYLVGRHIPGPPWCFPMVGSFPTTLLQQPDAGARWRALLRKYGNTLRLYAGPVLAVVVSEAEDMELVLNSEHCGTNPGDIPVFGLGLATLHDEEHRRHRRAISPSLHADILQSFVPAFYARALELCGRLQEFADSGEVVDATPLLARYNANAVRDTLLSTDHSDVEEEKAAFLHGLGTASRISMYRALRPWFSTDWMFSWSEHYDDYLAAARVIDCFSVKVVSMKLRNAQKDAAQHPEGRRRGFLDLALSSEDGKTLSASEMREELETLALGASSAATMDFLSFFLVCVAIEQDVQAKIHKELDEVFGGDVLRQVEPSDLSHLLYLDCALKEVLRMFPPVSAFYRFAEDEVTLPSSGYVVPQGSVVTLVPLLAHHNERWFPEPERFDPDRFLPDQARGRHPYAFIPFSAAGGRRNCVGQRYSLVSAKVAAACVLRRFRVLPDPDGPRTVSDVQDAKVETGMATTTLRGGAKIRVRSRRD